jgi:hypothetical protein
MFKKIVTLALIFLTISGSASFASGVPFQKFLLLKKNLLETKNNAWKLSYEIRELGKMEQWPLPMLQEELSEVEEITSSLGTYNKSFSLYNLNDFENDFAAVASKNQQVIEDLSLIKQRKNVHAEIKKMLEIIPKKAELAHNKTKQLLIIRQAIENFYRKKYDTAYPAEALRFIEKRMRADELLLLINRLELTISEIKKAEKDGFSISKKDGEEAYNPGLILQKLKDTESTLSAIALQSTDDIRNDNITLKAVMSLN